MTEEIPDTLQPEPTSPEAEPTDTPRPPLSFILPASSTRTRSASRHNSIPQDQSVGLSIKGLAARISGQPQPPPRQFAPFSEPKLREEEALCYWHTDPQDPCRTQLACGRRAHTELRLAVKANVVLNEKMKRMEEDYINRTTDAIWHIVDTLTKAVELHMEDPDWDGVIRFDGDLNGGDEDRIDESIPMDISDSSVVEEEGEGSIPIGKSE